MRGYTKYIALFLIVVTTACVDRINFDVGGATEYPVVVEGFITDQPGPYEVTVTRAFDVESKLSIKTFLNVRKIELFDNIGNVEQFTKIADGKYRTQGLIQGIVGRAYNVKVELLDGRIYESTPDTLQPTGTVDKLDHELVFYTNKKGIPEYGFDIFFDSQAGENTEFQFMWKTAMTYQVATSPENHRVACGGGTCPDPLDCSGYIWNDQTNSLQYVKPCTCCHCWITINQEIPVVSDNELVKNGKFVHIKAGRLPITGLTMAYKTHVEVQQFSLSQQAYAFWKAVKAQKEAITSLFQPLNGKIVGNFVQVSGEPGAMQGIFYASAVTKNSIYLSIDDLPVKTIVPPIGVTFNYSCLDFANSNNIQPDFWVP